MRFYEISIATRKLHPETYRNELILKPGCPCPICSSAYKMYLANSNGSYRGCVVRRAAATAALQEEGSSPGCCLTAPACATEDVLNDRDRCTVAAIGRTPRE
jgi:hypothetical protein